MADVAAKREARRRKILENSEYRLQRITGQANHNEQPVERSKTSIGTEVPSNSSRPTANGVLPGKAIIESQSVDSLIDELNAGIDGEESINQPLYSADHDIFTLLSTPNVPYRRNAGLPATSNENGNTSASMKVNTKNNVRFAPERQDSLGDFLLNTADRDNLNTYTNLESSLMNSLLSSRLIYVALAVVVNIMVILKLEHLFGMSIIIPFFVIMIGRLCTCKNDEVSQGINILIGALILSNVRPGLVKVIHRLKGSLSLSGQMLQDFAVYMFTFVLIHTALHRYWSDNLDENLPFPDEAQKIFDDNVSM